MKETGTKTPFIILAVLGAALIGMVYFAYMDHFNNPFQFDDHHTIQSNMYIRDLKNIPKFFSDATTTSSLPANQAYRPGLTILNTIDYALSGEKAEPKPFQFHLSIFICFILLGFLIYFFALKIFNLTKQHRLNPYIAFIITAVFMLHTANAETINYVISRSDSFSTLMIMAALVMFAYQKGPGRYFWYLIPMVLAFFVKEPGVLVGPLAFLFFILFEEQYSVKDIFKNAFGRSWNIFVKFLPAFILAVLLFGFAKAMTPKTWTSGNDQFVPYWLTQTFVMVHYVTNYFFPFNLSADTDWGLIKNPFDDRVIAGVLFIIATLYLAYRCSFKRETKPVAYGILWFYICLVPTSIMPFAEVLNDHRVFLPYIGLTIAVVGGLFSLYIRYEESVKDKKSSSLPIINAFAVLFIAGLLVAHMFGVRTRCEVWSSGETLWKDVTIKSPRNGRGLMNYGNAMMGKGDYATAEEYFLKAKQEWPYYSYIYTNLGVLYSAKGNAKLAEENFLKARQLNSQNPEFYYFYAVFLRNQGRFSEAVQMVNTGIGLSPQHPGLNTLKSNLLSNPQYAASEAERISMAEKQVKDNNTPESWLNLSLIYYNAGRYQDCVNAAQEALKLRPTYDLAYNNICSAYNMMKEWDKAIAAGEKAVELNPGSQLAKNNLKAAKDGKAKGL